MSALSIEIAERLSDLSNTISGLGRELDGKDVTLVAVTKFHDISVVEAAYEAGIKDLGENLATELAEKSAAVPEPNWHFIGQLQTNKVKVVAGLVALYQSVDRPSLIKEIAKRDPGAHVLIQVNLGDGGPEAVAPAGRGGADPTDVPALVEKARESGLIVSGVMGVAPNPQSRSQDLAAGEAFRNLRSIADSENLKHCSMGMSGDFRIAVSEGSTMIRVGGALFGRRPDSQ